MEIAISATFGQFAAFYSSLRQSMKLYTHIRKVVLREKNEIEPRSSSLVFLGRQNKCFISEYRKSGDSSFFFCDGDYFLIGLPGSSYVYTHRVARRKISDVLRVSSTIYALLSGVNNNQLFSLLQEEENVLNPITDIPSAPPFSLSSPSRATPDVILNYKWPFRFGNERSALPTTDSSPCFSCNFFASPSGTFCLILVLARWQQPPPRRCNTRTRRAHKSRALGRINVEILTASKSPSDKMLRSKLFRGNHKSKDSNIDPKVV